jgi:hypothetical protein
VRGVCVRVVQVCAWCARVRARVRESEYKRVRGVSRMTVIFDLKLLFRLLKKIPGENHAFINLLKQFFTLFYSHL